MRKDFLNPIHRTLAFLALGGLVLFSCVSKGATRFYCWPWVFYGELLLMSPVLLLAFEFRPTAAAVLPRRAAAALLITAAAVGISMAYSHRPLFSLEVSLFLWGGLALAALVALLVVRHQESRSPSLPRCAGVLLALPVLSSLGIWLWSLVPRIPATGPLGLLLWFRNQRNPHPAGHWNYTGGLALLALPWLLALALKERGKWRVLWLLLTACTAVVLLSAASRGTTLGVVAGLATAALAYALERGLRRRQLILLVIGAGVAGTLMIAANPRVQASLFQSSDAFVPTEGDIQRLAMIQGGAQLFLASPWIGHGPGMTPFAYPAVRARLVGGVETSFQLHNAPLQCAVDLGVIGLGATTLLLATAAVGARRWWRERENPLRPYALASAGALLVYGVLAITDYQLSVVGVTAGVAFHLGVLLAGNGANAGSPKPGNRPRIPALLLLCGLTAAIVALVPTWRARELFWSAWWTIDEKDGAAIAARLRTAADTAPWNPHYRTHLGLFLASRAASPAEQADARRELERSLAIDPLQEPCEAALGWLWLQEDPPAAEARFHAALALIPDRDTLHLGLGLAQLAQGRVEEAVHALGTECLVNPEFVASPLWRTDPLRSLEQAVALEAERLFAAVLADPELPQWRQPALRYTQAFERWWRHGPAPTSAELAGATALQRAAFAALAEDRGQKGHAEPPPPLAVLREAFAHLDRRTGLLAERSGLPRPAIIGAEARLAAAPGNFADLLRSPAPDGVGGISSTIDRHHYSIMQRNLDGPGYRDLFPRVADSFTETFAGPLYPPRGLVPGPVLARLSPAAPTSEASARPDPAVVLPAAAQP